MFFLIKAFQNAWEEVCQSGGTISIIGGTYLLNTIQFAGPCNGQVSFMVNAVIQAPQGQSDAHYWISFDKINDLTIQGNGTFDGQGSSAWSFNDCHNAALCTPLSTVSSVLSRNFMQYQISNKNSYPLHFSNNSFLFAKLLL